MNKDRCGSGTVNKTKIRHLRVKVTGLNHFVCKPLPEHSFALKWSATKWHWLKKGDIPHVFRNKKRAR